MSLVLLDTNIVIYACKPKGDWLSSWVEHPDAAFASISRVEALGFPGLTPNEEVALRQLFAVSRSFPLSEEVIEQAISLRRTKKSAVADAVIAATALIYGLPLVTRNERDFQHIAGLEVINPFASGQSS